MTATITGGAKLEKYLASAGKGVKGVRVGWPSTARYPDGTYAAAVAAWNEFGTEKHGRQFVPERPFIRNAIDGAEEDIVRVIEESLQGSQAPSLGFSSLSAGMVGQVMVARIQQSITTLRDPPNSPVTIAMKGSTNPLIDTGFMRMSVTYVIDQ